MKKEVLIESKNINSLATNTQVLRNLLHLRWELGDAGQLSLFPEKHGVRLVVSDEEKMSLPSVLDAVLHKAEQTIRNFSERTK